jgi:hypothetical protein
VKRIMPMLILSLTMHGMMHLLLRFVQDFGVNPVKLGRDFVKILPRKFAGVANKIRGQKTRAVRNNNHQQHTGLEK